MFPHLNIPWLIPYFSLWKKDKNFVTRNFGGTINARSFKSWSIPPSSEGVVGTCLSLSFSFAHSLSLSIFLLPLPRSCVNTDNHLPLLREKKKSFSFFFFKLWMDDDWMDWLKKQAASRLFIQASLDLDLKRKQKTKKEDERKENQIQCNYVYLYM